MDILVFVVAIVLAILIGQKSKANIGVIAIGMAFLIGAAYFKLTPSTIMGCFPTSIFYYMFFGTFFYGFGVHNGTFQNIAQKILYKFGSSSRFLPIVMFLTTVVVQMLGAGSTAGPAFVSPIFFGIITEMGMNPLIAAIATFAPSTACNFLPWTSDFQSKTSVMHDIFGVELSNTVGITALFYDLIFLFCCFIVVCIFTGAFKKREAKTFEKPAPMTDIQKKTLGVIVALAVLLVIPMICKQFLPNPVTSWISKYYDFRSLAAIGICVCHFLKIGSIDEVIKKSIPWGSIFTVCGMGTLVGLAAEIGITETIGNWLGSSVPAAIIGPVFMLICGLLSLAVSGNVLRPLLVTLIPGICASTGYNPLVLALCMQVGLQYAGFSPFSMGGTMATIGCADEDMRKKLVGPMITCAIAFVVVTAILAGLGLFDLFFAGVDPTLPGAL